MYDRMREEVAWVRLQDVQREAENRRLTTNRFSRHALDVMGERIWMLVGLRFGWLPTTFSDVA